MEEPTTETTEYLKLLQPAEILIFTLCTLISTDTIEAAGTIPPTCVVIYLGELFCGMDIADNP